MSKKILIVDDSKSMRAMISMALEETGYTTLEAENGLTGFSSISVNKPDLIITDINMPEMNGIELIQNVRSDSLAKFIPIVVITTESEDEKKNEAMSAGATSWLVKPFDPDELNACVSRLLV